MHTQILDVPGYHAAVMRSRGRPRVPCAVHLKAQRVNPPLCAYIWDAGVGITAELHDAVVGNKLLLVFVQLWRKKGHKTMPRAYVYAN